MFTISSCVPLRTVTPDQSMSLMSSRESIAVVGHRRIASCRLAFNSTPCSTPAALLRSASATSASAAERVSSNAASSASARSALAARVSPSANIQWVTWPGRFVTSVEGTSGKVPAMLPAGAEETYAASFSLNVPSSSSSPLPGGFDLSINCPSSSDSPSSPAA